jgi:hypothetical protein
MVSPELFSKFIRALSKTLHKWSPDFSDQEIVEIWYESFKDYTEDDLKRAFILSRENLEEFPSIKKLKYLIETGMANEQEIADDVSARIEHAIGAYGYTNPGEAQKYIGEIGWTVIDQLGGWNNACEVLINDLPSARRQWRELAKVVNVKKRTGTLDQAPKLPIGAKTLIDNLSNSTLSLEEKKK